MLRPSAVPAPTLPAKTVLIAGATGYLGRYLVEEYARRGWRVKALVRRDADLPAEMVHAEATRPDTLHDTMDGVDLVISALGITRQRDGLTYRDVDYQANANLLAEAVHAGVSRFAYVHVLNADRMAHVPLVAAKTEFVTLLRAAPIASTVIAPSGYFSDMGDFLDMARNGRVWLFGSGAYRINPIHGADLAHATAEAIVAGRDWLDVGGPEALSHSELAALAFETLGKPPRITRLPDALRRMAMTLLPWVTPARINGPALFFLTAMGGDMVGELHGSHRLADHFSDSSSVTEPETKMTLIKIGGLAALACAITYMVGFALLLTLLAPLGYGTDTIDPVAVVAFTADNPGLMIAWNSTIYIVNALALVLLVLAIHARLSSVTPAWAEATRGFGLIWAALVLGAGMIANVSVEEVSRLAVIDPAAAAQTWAMLHAVELGLGGGNEIAGGIWMLCVGLGALSGASLPRMTALFAVMVGAAGLLTVVPASGEATGAIFGLGAILWFVLVGVSLLRNSPTGP
ncbi:SDR family oxidoreductase [Nioella aestuarii]|uniref:SDR family oxidoreductase n=1 Tax=Nioella aestuarii TaxID=1662864 RepID=UPI003D7F95F1